MIKKLTKHGNSLALVIEKPILELLKIDADTELEVSTDGKNLVVKPKLARLDPRDAVVVGATDEVHKAMEWVNREYAGVLTNLAKGAS